MKVFCSMAKLSRRKIMLNIICNVYQDVTDDSWIPEARSPHRHIHNDHQWLFIVDPLLIPSLIVKKQPRCKSELLHAGNQATKQPRLRQRKWRGRGRFQQPPISSFLQNSSTPSSSSFLKSRISSTSSSLSSKLLTSTPFPDSPHHNDIVTFKARSMTRLVRLRERTSEEEEALETTSRAVWRKKLKLFFVDNRARSSWTSGQSWKKHQLCWFFKYCHT